MKNAIFIMLVFLLFSCRQSPENTDQIYQYSVFTALANKIYDGSITVSDIKEKGDIGLGTYNGLNGEMIVLDGIVYQFLSDGTVLQPDDSEWVPFSVVTFFESDFSIEIREPSNYEDLKAQITEFLPSENTAYAFQIKGKFDWINCGSAEKQEMPYTKTLSDALVDRPVFESENISGTLVGFWYPEYIGKVNVEGFHLHFISDNRESAGHLIDFQSADLSVSIDQCSGFNIELPDTEEFKNAHFDLNQEYSNPANNK